MLDAIYDKINDYGSVTIRLASPQDIRNWSYGEVRKPETINYRTYRAEKDGLFCERIFGPERDWECFCGKFKGIKHKGIICDRCGVKITHSRVRRKRMGHINLAAPVAHIWFFKAMPSRIGSLLAMKTASLERIIYFQDYVVVDAGDTPLKRKQLLEEDDYREAVEKHRKKFKAGMGAEAIKNLLEGLDLSKLADRLREELENCKSKQRTKDYIKRLKTVTMLKESANDPDWMILEVIPVIPPDLRPLVLLESGNFATSDLNDLYRRLINRNNRLKKLLDLNAPEVIIRNEKRMLQQAADSLFDNNRCRRPVMGSNNRPLKSLTDMIKGKQGRFRENLLGKRVDYSGRSVIVVGPELKLHQCGLPKKIALELFQPFIIRRLKELGHADTIKSAKKMLERKDEQVWDILEEVIHEHPVLLNRAPTLHRMGIQAFEPVLIEGNAIKIHPLVCAGFNADFDGDQMAVHLPLSYEAQVEAATLMLATHNIFSPANGMPIIAPSQDIVLGCYYLSIPHPPSQDPEKASVFGTKNEVFLAYAEGKVGMHEFIKLRMPEGKPVFGLVKNAETGEMERRREEAVGKKSNLYLTTVGRIIFNDILPDLMPYYNFTLTKKQVNSIVADSHKYLDITATLKLLDDLKDLGFKAATLAGLSFSCNDLKMPPDKKEILDAARGEVEKIEKNFRRAAITEGERHNAIIDRWTHATEEVGKSMMTQLENDIRDGVPFLNPIYMMAASGARGSVQQIRQLAGMRGLMAKPSGQVIETPITANFREGLKVLEYFSSTHGARKGLADTALKTADSGYLTRKLADVAQNVVINEPDCSTLRGITKGQIRQGEKIVVTLAMNIRGRVARDTIADIVTDEVIIRENEMLTHSIADKIQSLNYRQIRVRSPLTCETPIGVCGKCYGMDLSRGELVEAGLAVGIIAAQSIGEPGTQLTMRTFHYGGVLTGGAGADNVVKAEKAGKIKYINLNVVKNKDKQNIVLNQNGELGVADDRDRIIDRYPVKVGSVLKVKEGAKVRSGQSLAEWDKLMSPILVEQEGYVDYEDLIIGETIRIEKDLATGAERKVVIEHKGDKHPQIILKDKKGNILGAILIPEKAHLEVERGQYVTLGTRLARIPREISGVQDITGGLPRVTEIFEVRKPKSPSVMSEIDGRVVMLSERRRGKRILVVKNEETGMEREHAIPPGKRLVVRAGDYVKAGQPLVEGPLIPQDILRISGEEALQQYLLTEVQSVYRAQNVPIDDKHIEIILSQMMRKVQVTDPGNTSFLPGAVVDKYRWRIENEMIRKEKKKPAKVEPMLLGITKASLFSESFLSAASFQETTKVLTEAALSGTTDHLLGLKENVILGHMIPAGTGFKGYLDKRVKKEIRAEKN
ncbi:MAG: DNA-directed RNA polymerase subunit beta' [Planctomycetota bacterium]|jgi:DNA-directed RNA polymerase subunit beta'